MPVPKERKMILFLPWQTCNLLILQTAYPLFQADWCKNKKNTYLSIMARGFSQTTLIHFRNFASLFYMYTNISQSIDYFELFNIYLSMIFINNIQVQSNSIKRQQFFWKVYKQDLNYFACMIFRRRHWHPSPCFLLTICKLKVGSVQYLLNKNLIYKNFVSLAL